VRYLEKLALPHSLEYRVALDEGNIAAFATALLEYLEKNKDPEEVILTTSLELCELLKQVRGEDFRWFHKTANKIKKRCSK
jgi:hypothetical protein